LRATDKLRKALAESFCAEDGLPDFKVGCLGCMIPYCAAIRAGET